MNAPPTNNSFPPDVSQGARLMASSTVLYAIALTLFSLRIYARIQGGKVGSDDFFIVVAMACGTGYYIIGIISVAHGLGRHMHYLSPSDISWINRLNLFSIAFYLWSNTAVKVSLACLMLRLKSTEALWRRGLHLAMAFLVLLCLGLTLFNFLQCRPLKALWDLSIPRDRCIPKTRNRSVVYFGTAIFLTTDVLFSCLPVPIILTIRRPLRERLVLCFLMALGLVASSTCIPKLPNLRYLGVNPDYTWVCSDIDMWSLVEILLAISAACVPPLKNMMENTLKRWGLLTSEDSNTGIPRRWSFRWSSSWTWKGITVRSEPSRPLSNQSDKILVKLREDVGKVTKESPKDLDPSVMELPDKAGIMVTVDIEQNDQKLGKGSVEET